MSLIEGIGDEVTILVTVIVAVTTVVAAWFSTSVTEQHSYWQDEPGSPVDPEPPSQQSTTTTTTSEDGISEVAENNERPTLETFSEELTGFATESIDRTFPLPDIDVDAENHSTNIEEDEIVNSGENTEDVIKSDACGYEEGTKPTPASQNSSFECIEATNDVHKSSTGTFKPSAESPNIDTTDGVSNYERPPSDIVEERVENVHIQSEEQSVRRRHTPNTTAEKSESQTRQDDQSQSPSQTETVIDSQSESVSQDNPRRENPPQMTRDQAASGVITIKLRFLDETERVVSTNMADTLGNFRRETFSSEMQSGQTVRLISNGQLLSEDSRTLASYGITNQQVIHCQISQASPHNHPGHQHLETGDGEFDLGRYMVPLFACILAFMWYLRFQYRYMFNATSTLSLTAVSAVFLLALLAVWRT